MPLSNPSDKPPTANNRRGDGPKYVYGDQDSDPEPRTYPRGRLEGDKQVISRPCRVEAATQTNAVGPRVMTLVLRATDGDIALPTADSEEPRRTVQGLVFYTITPQVNDTGYKLVFERPRDSANTVPYVYVQTEKPAF